MNVYITFSGKQYDDQTRRIVENAEHFGAHKVWVYDDAWLVKQDFYRQNQWLWNHSHKRGFGWYAWKPFIIHHALSRLADGDVVLYTDADTYPIAPLDRLFETAAREGMMLFASEGHRQFEWCKADCYAVMSQALDESLQAGVARFMLFQKGPWRTTQFLMEWLTYCVNQRANTFDASALRGEHSMFVEHRAEQAIMTNLAHKYGVYLYREACGAGEGSSRDRALYGQLFHQVDHLDKTSIAPEGSVYANV